MEMMEQQNKQKSSVLEQNTIFFLRVALLYGICFAIAFYKNYVGITFPIITIVTLVGCGLFLKKSEIAWKAQNLFFVISIILLGISTMLTTNTFIVFFNSIGILLLLTVFMLQQIYPDNKWNLIKYIRNIILLYLTMISQIAVPFLNWNKYRQEKRERKQKNPNTKYIVQGILIGLPMLVLVIALLSSADAVFGKYIGESFQVVLNNIYPNPNKNGLVLVGLIILGFMGIYTFLSVLDYNDMSTPPTKKEKKNPITAITFITMITVVYIIFSVIQIVCLFSGGMILPEGYTYAGYARQGFFQLLFLCIFNLMLVLCCMSVYERNRLLKVLLMIFSGCTYIMIASSAYRMILYISAFRLTFLRVLVLWFLALLAVLMIGVMWNIRKENFALFRYGMVMVTVFYLALSFSHPDYWIAKYNIAMMEEELCYEDLSYLCSLSLDAAPALAECHPKHTGKDYWCDACVLERYFEKIEKGTSLNIRTFNLSKYQSLKAAEEYLGE